MLINAFCTSAFMLLTQIIYVQMTHYPIKLKLQETSEHIYPSFVDFEGQKVILTSCGSYLILTNGLDEYYLELVDSFFGSQYERTKDNRGYLSYQGISGDKRHYLFQTVDNKMILKKYNGKEYIEEETDIKLKDPNSIISFSNILMLKTAFSYIGTNENANKGVLYSYSCETHTMSNPVLTDNILPTSGLFQCQYLLADVWFCLFPSGGNEIKAIEFDYFGPSFKTPLTIYTLDPSETDSFVAVQYVGTSLNQFMAIGWVSPSNILWIFQGIYDEFSIEINTGSKTSIPCNDIRSMGLTLINNDRLLVWGSNGIETIVEFYSFQMERLSLEGKNIGGYQDFNFGTFDNLLVFTSIKENNPEYLNYIEYEIVECEAKIFDFVSNIPQKIKLTDLAKNSVKYLEDESGMILFKEDNNIGGPLKEINNLGETISDITFNDLTHVIPILSYTPNTPGQYIFKYRLYYIVTDTFYLPTTTCQITFNNNCYFTCQTCTYIGNEENHQCDSCPFGSYVLEDINNCYYTPPPGYYLDTTIWKYRRCKANCYSCENEDTCTLCNTDYSLLSQYTLNSDQNVCVLNCDLSNSRWYIDSDGSFVCLENQDYCTPEYAFYNENKKECLNKEQAKVEENNNIELPSKIDPKKLVDYFDKNIMEYYKKNYSLLTDTYHALVYDTFRNMSEMTTSRFFSRVNFGNCDKKLRKAYQLANNEAILIAHIELLNATSINSMYLDFYSSTGKKLSPEKYCRNETVTINYNVDQDNLSLSLKEISEMKDENIDVFNPQDDFFNDKCFPYSSKNNTSYDVSMDIRRKNYYQKVPVCGEGCKYIEMDSVNLISSCSCEIGNIVDKDNDNDNNSTKSLFIKNGIIKDFISIISNSNYIVIKCYKKVFVFDIFVTNLGNFLMLINLVGQIINLILYLRHGNEIFQAYIENSLKEKDALFQFLNNSSFNKSKTIINVINVNASDMSENKKENYQNINMYPPLPAKTIIDYPNEKNHEFLDKLELLNAQKYDKRLFSQLFIYRVKQFHPIYVSFFSVSSSSIKFIEISNFFFNISSNLAFNALFYEDKYISNAYYNGYSIVYQIPKSIYSSLIGLFVTILSKIVKVGFPSNESLRIAKMNNKEKEMRIKVVKKMKKMNILYFIILFSFSFFFWYFITAFCSVYENSQVSWIIDSFVSISISLLVPILMALLNTIFRKVSLKYQIHFLFYFSRFIDSYH